MKRLQKPGGKTHDSRSRAVGTRRSLLSDMDGKAESAVQGSFLKMGGL